MGDQPVQHLPVAFALSPEQHRMGLAGDQVEDIRMPGHYFLQRPDADLQALARANQPKGGDHLSPGIAVLLLEPLPVLRLKDRNPMVHNADFLRRDRIDNFQQARRALGHGHNHRRSIG